MIKNTNSNNSPSYVTNKYSNSKGTGVLSTLIFAIVVTVIMVAIAYIKG